MPYQHDVNIYRGCEHGCLYCYALYSHDYLDDEKFYDHIFIREYCKNFRKKNQQAS
ncbi:MAG: hypothetical protein ACLUIS_06815 [Longibaculum sp.]